MATKQGKTAMKSSAGNEAEDAVSLLTADHRQVESLFDQYQPGSETSSRSELAHKVCIALTVHAMVEEEIFYPACRAGGVQHEALDEAQVEHDAVKVLVQELMTHRPEDEFYDAKFKVLSEYVKHHVQEEEKAGEGIFAKAAKAGLDMSELGRRIKERKAELMARVEQPGFKPSAVRSLDVVRQGSHSKERDMDRRYERERDDQGRFVESDDSRGYSGGGYRGRESGGGPSRGWYGDPEGHSRASEEGWEHRRGGGGGGGGYSRGRDYGDDDRRYGGGGGGGRGQSGWYGDPEGHSRASEEGWEHRRGGGGGGGYSRGRDYGDDDRRSGYGGGGSGRGHGGWFGDPEGHARASEEGWEHRRGGGGYSRGRDYGDDDSRSSGSSGRGGGHGGWFGDPEGHSRASEEGWEHRRGGGYSRGR